MCPKVEWQTQGLCQSTDFWVLPLQGFDAVFGLPWLKKLGLITWDFQSLQI